MHPIIIGSCGSGGDNGVIANLKADNAFNIDEVKMYDFGNYNNSIVLWMEDGGFRDRHTGIILKYPNSYMMNNAWNYITTQDSWIP